MKQGKVREDRDEYIPHDDGPEFVTGDLDWPFWANILFLFASILYVASSVCFYFPEKQQLAVHLSLAGALLFLVDAVISLGAWCNDRHMRVQTDRFHRHVEET